MNLPDSAENLVIKVYAVIATACSSRGIEIIFLVFLKVKTFIDHCIITISRAKQTGPPEEVDVLITGTLEVAIINRYIKCFPKNDQEGRFFRKLTNRKGVICSTKQVIGKNTSSEYGKVIGSLLGLKDANLYTGKKKKFKS
jgi:hypothetical protein